jgi:hypothetical protein
MTDPCFLLKGSINNTWLQMSKLAANIVPYGNFYRKKFILHVIGKVSKCWNFKGRFLHTHNSTHILENIMPSPPISSRTTPPVTQWNASPPQPAITAQAPLPQEPGNATLAIRSSRAGVGVFNHRMLGGNQPAHDRWGDSPVDPSDEPDSWFSMGPQEELQHLGSMADCGQYAAGATQYTISSIDPLSMSVQPPDITRREPVDMDALHACSTQFFNQFTIPENANRVAYGNTVTGQFHYAKIHRSAATGQVTHLSHTDSSWHLNEPIQGGTARIYDSRGGKLTLVAQRGLQPPKKLDDHRAFTDYCESEYGANQGLYFFVD